MDCIFCKIISRDIPGEIVDEGPEYLAFLDIGPRSPGHTMVIPKYHAATLLELPDEKVKELFIGVKKVADRLNRALAPDGLTIGINQGDASGQEVKHLHVHIMPRWNSDKGSAVQGVVSNQPKEPLSEIANKIRNTK